MVLTISYRFYEVKNIKLNSLYSIQSSTKFNFSKFAKMGKWRRKKKSKI